MSHFIDDALTPPNGKSDLRAAPSGQAGYYVTAAEWNAVMQYLIDIRSYSLRSAGTDTVPVLKLPDATTLELSGSAPDSRDAPVNGIIFQNTGLPNNPRVLFGNPYVAGIGKNAGGLWYTDDSLGGVWKLILSFEQTGTLAAVGDGVRRSLVEAFVNHGDNKPIARIFEASSQAMQIGPGGFVCDPGGAVRSGGVLTLTTATVGGIQQLHKMGVGQLLLKEGMPGYAGNVSTFGANGANWGPAGSTMAVASVVDQHTITVTDARSNATNTDQLSFSCECSDDVGWGRDDYGVAAVRAKGSTVCRFNEFGVAVPSGLSVLGEGASLNLGVGGGTKLSLLADEVQVLDGLVLNNQGKYRSQIWFNGGGQTQSAQECFVVGTGGGNQQTFLPVALEGQRLEIKNAGQGGSHTLEIIPAGGAQIEGAASLIIPANAAVQLRAVSAGGDWFAWYCPPP